VDAGDAPGAVEPEPARPLETLPELPLPEPLLALLPPPLLTLLPVLPPKFVPEEPGQGGYVGHTKFTVFVTLRTLESSD
jgi:hypothetical protein